MLISGPGGQRDGGIIYQVSAMDLLKDGSFDGFVTVGEVRGHGDFGIGTFDRLDGEAIILDGTVYQARADGTVHVMGDQDTMPFAVITYFDADHEARIIGPINYPALTAALDGAPLEKRVLSNTHPRYFSVLEAPKPAPAEQALAAISGPIEPEHLRDV